MKAESEELKNNYTFIYGAVRYKDLIYFAVLDDAVDPDTDPHFCPLTYDRDQWGSDIILKWSPVSMTICKHPFEQMVAIGENGEAYSFGSGHEDNEIIAVNKQSPLDLGGPLRHVRGVGKHAYAVGMKRQVYRRDDINYWVRIDKGVYSDKEGVFGFEALDGFNDKDIYAVGWEGEIWHLKGTDWFRDDSPTNLILTDVCCAGNGIVYICGQMGTLLTGINGSWSIIDTGINDNLWSMSWFKDCLYVAAYSGIYRLIDQQLERINFMDDIPTTFYQLSSCDDLLCSIGGKDVMVFDGQSWSRIV